MIGASGEALGSARLLRDELQSGAGVSVPVTSADDPEATIRLGVDRDVDDNPEGYRLDVAEDGVDLVGASPSGLARGVQTLRQLLPPEALGPASVLTEPASLPCCTIGDAPRYRWRGVHLDVARHWLPPEFLFRLVDVAALHRLNVVHLHLTDDQGWRLEVPGRPRLTEIGAWRAQTMVGHAKDPRGYDGTPHGGYYTVSQLRELVEYAAARHITVVPEIDLPGHVQALLAAYPELGCTGQALATATGWGISEHVLAPTNEALDLAREVLDTVVDVFPGPYVHLGGDECPRTQWRESATATARARELGLGSVDELQSWFLRTLAAHLADHGRRVVGWDEVLDDGGMRGDTVIMAWRSAKRGAAAVRAGHDVVMSPQELTYFDHYQSDDPGEPLAIGGLTTLEDVAAFDPTPPGTAGEAVTGALLGVQGQLWTEYLPTPESVEYMAFPRLSALAEVGWLPSEHRDASDLLRRIEAHLPRLSALHVNYRRPTR